MWVFTAAFDFSIPLSLGGSDRDVPFVTGHSTVTYFQPLHWLGLCASCCPPRKRLFWAKLWTQSVRSSSCHLPTSASDLPCHRLLARFTVPAVSSFLQGGSSSSRKWLVVPWDLPVLYWVHPARPVSSVAWVSEDSEAVDSSPRQPL